jgi:TetR/AcrR family transcriptional repressor of mexJK operon
MDRRSHYLDIALRLFSEHGYHGVSMDQLVAAAGGSKATLYRYFSSKEHLFDAIIEDLSAATLRDGAPVSLEGLTLEDGLRYIASAVVAGALAERTTVMLRLALGEYTRFPALARSLFERGPAVSYRRLTEFLEAKERQGVVSIPDRQIAAEQFLGGIVGHQQLRLALGVSQPSKHDMEARIDAAVRVFVRAYATVSY